MSASSATSASFIESSRPAPALLKLNPAVCAEAIGRREFGMAHSIAEHPLMSLEALAELADSLPPAAVECHAAQQPLLVPGGCAEEVVRPSDIVRNLDNSGRWMVLWNIEQSPRYRQLIDRLLDEALPLLPSREGSMGRREAFLFLSAPNAVTPVHFDPENNFLLQLRGSKQVLVGRFPDRNAELSELDRYHDGGHRNLVQIPPQSSSFELQSGDGVYIYPWAPHWVYNGPTASLSLSITFRTLRSERAELVHRCNARLRRLGYAPRPAGESAITDWLKASYVGVKGWLRRGGRQQLGTRDFS